MRENENETRGVTTDGHARRWSGASPKVIDRVDGFSRSMVFKVFPRVDIGKKRGLKKSEAASISNPRVRVRQSSETRVCVCVVREVADTNVRRREGTL